MGGYDPNPPADSDAAPKTKEEAEAIAGQQVGFRGTYGGEQGRAAQNYAILQQNRQVQQRQAAQQQPQGQPTGQQAPSGRPTKYMGWEGDQDATVQRPNYTADAIQQYIQSRPRFMDTSQFGNTQTQAALNQVPSGTDRDAALGKILEAQRQAATLTPGLADDRFFENQLSLWNAQKIEASSGEHYFKKQSTDPINWTANTRENVGDIALGWEKAGNTKDNLGKNYAFNPNVGTLVSVLPKDANGQPMGLQEYDWRGAVANYKGTDQPAPVDWNPAIDYINSQAGRQGVYGNLYGGKPDVITPTPVTNAKETAMATPISAFGEANAKRPFVSANVQTEVIKPTGEIDVFGNKFVIPGLAFFQQPVTKTTNTLPQVEGKNPFAMAFGDNFQFKAATDINKLDTSPWVPSKGEVAIGSPEYSAAVPFGVPIVTTKFNPQTGMTETVTEQRYNREVTQKYETWDMSKQTVTPVVTTFAPGKSGLDNLNEYVSDKYIKPYTPTPDEATRSGYAFLRVGKLVEGKGRVITDADITSFEKNTPYAAASVKFFTEGFYGGARDKPVTAGVSFGAGVGIGAIFRGAGMLTPIVERVAGPTVTKVLTFTGGKVIPVALTGIYGYDVASRSTEGFTNYQPSYVSKNLGEITSTEIFPAVAGFNAAYGFRRSTPTPGTVQERTTFFEQEPVRYPKGYVQSTVVRSDILMAQELQIRPEIKTLDLTRMLPEANLETGKYTGLYRPGNIASLSEQAMVMRQFQLTPQEIRLAKMQGLSLNDILGLRALEAPVTAVTQPVQVYNVQQMFSQKPLTITMLETPTRQLSSIQLSSLYGNQQLIGNNLVQSLVRTQERVNYQDAIPAIMQMGYGMVGTSSIIGSNVVQQLSRSQVSKQDELSIPTLVSWQGTVTPQKEDTRTRQAIMPNLMTGTIQTPFSTTITKPKTETLTRPWTDTTWTKVPVPLIPILPSFPGGSGGAGVRGRPRRARTITPWGLDIATFGRTRPTLTRSGTYGVPRQPRPQPMPSLPKKGKRRKK